MLAGTTIMRASCSRVYVFAHRGTKLHASPRRATHATAYPRTNTYVINRYGTKSLLSSLIDYLVANMLPLLMMRHRRIPRAKWRDCGNSNGKRWIEQVRKNSLYLVHYPSDFRVRIPTALSIRLIV